MPRDIITEIRDRKHFTDLLLENPGLLIIKFGAEWCSPCKLIEDDVKKAFDTMPDNVQCAIIDIDNNFDVYAYLKTRKMISGIPAILCYSDDNTDFCPNEFHSGSDKTKLKEFFNRCMKLL